MANKESEQTTIQPDVPPVLKLVDDGSRIFLDVKALGITPFIYALTLSGNTAVGFKMLPETEQYSFKTLGDRARYLSALNAMMQYQHTHPDVKRVLIMYDSEIQDFNRRIQQLDTSR